MAFQGTFEFGTVRYNVSGSVTVTHGISPSTITLRCAAQAGPFPYRAPCFIRYGSVTIEFPNCLLDDVNYNVGDDGLQYSTFTILDRRWKWQGFGWISGEYNVKKSDKPNTLMREMSPRKLATLCFQALQETRFDVSKMPDDTRPYVDWDGQPAEYLSQLCDDLACRIVYDVVSDTFRVMPAGDGMMLPAGFDLTSGSLSINPPQVPDKIVFRAGKTLRESLLELEFIGEEQDGEIRLIDDLSWKPSNGWSASYPPDWPDVAKNFRELARKCIYRMFRIKMPANATVKELWQILPTESTRLVTKQLFTPKIILDGEERIPAMLVGEWYGGSELDTAEVKTVNTPKGKYAVYQRGFSYDAERGIVHTSAPVYLYQGNDPLLRKIIAPKLWLWIAHGVRDAKTGAWERYEKSYVPPGTKLGTQPAYIDRRDIELRYWFQSTPAGAAPVNNQTEVDQHAQFYITEYLRNLQMTTPGIGGYGGIKPFPMDGAINSITWSVDERGYARTTIVRNQERIGVEQTYKESRFLQALSALRKADAAKRTQRKKSG